MFLQALHIQTLVDQRPHAIYRRLSRGQRSDQRDLHACCQRADLGSVLTTAWAQGRIDDQWILPSRIASKVV